MRLGDGIDIPTEYESAVMHIATLLSHQHEDKTALEQAIEAMQVISGRSMDYEYVDKNRAGDHICYISDLRAMCQEYLSWHISKRFEMLFKEIYSSWLAGV